VSKFIEDMEVLRNDLEALLGRHARKSVKLVITPSVTIWAEHKAVGINGSPLGLAVRALDCSEPLIVLQQRITEQQADSVVERIFHGGSEQAFYVLESPQQFARHLLLHELAHIENNWGQEREDECDLWAFERLPHVA
jgi:hypothetical protein